MQPHYYVYIITNDHHTVFYTGVTNHLLRRMHEHKNKLRDGFTKKYNLHKLVYYEVTNDVMAALHREKIIKRWKRSIKFDAINKLNARWIDLYSQMEKDPAMNAG